MARTPTDADITEFAPSEVVEKNLAEMKPLVDAKSMADAIVQDAEDAFKIVGHIEAAEFMLTVSEKMIAESAIKIKKGKLFKHFLITDESGNRRHVSNFEEFCSYKLNKSRQRIEELIRNYNLLGPDLYEKAEKLGFGQRDYNALKALPEDDRKIITQAMEEENFQKALDLMSMMAAKHEADKQAAKKQQEELQATLDAKDAVVQKKQEELVKKDRMIDGLNEKLALHEHKALTATPDEKAALARNAFSHASLAIKANIETDLRGALSRLMDTDGNHVQVAGACILELMRELRVLRDEFRLPHTIDDEAIQNPIWKMALNDLEGAQTLDSDD
jgi:hypothetical protein